MFKHQSEVHHRHYIYLENPAALQTEKACRAQDARLAGYIEDLEKELEILRGLRMENFHRMQEIFSVCWEPMVKLERRRSYYDRKVTYTLSHYRYYPSGELEPERISSREYPGTARRQALADYNAYVNPIPESAPSCISKNPPGSADRTNKKIPLRKEGASASAVIFGPRGNPRKNRWKNRRKFRWKFGWKFRRKF